jgi:L-ascorbate metabolism protein UlaG (beta-lactamase superfamily)
VWSSLPVARRCSRRPFTAVHVDHSSELLWHNPTADKDETHVGGEPVGYIIELENGFKIYHMADTSVT